MQVTKNEKIVQVLQEETYDIKGLSKAEAIVLLLLLSKSNGDYAYNIYYALDKSLKMNNQIDSHISFSVPTIDLHSVRHEIKKLAQE